MRRLASVTVLALFPLVACKHDDATAYAGGDSGGAATTSTAAVTTGATRGGALSSTFEGTIAMHVTSPHGAEDIAFETKAGKLRFDAPARNGENAHVVFDPSTNKVLVILDQQKMYMDMERPAAAAQAARAKEPAPEITKTGKHETIAGTDCEDWNVTEANGKRSELCVAQGVAYFDFASAGPGGPPSAGWVEELRAQKYFPLRAVELDPAGKETTRMDVTKIEAKSIDDAEFAPPPSYHAMNIPHVPGLPAGMSAIPNMPHH